MILRQSTPNGKFPFSFVSPWSAKIAALRITFLPELLGQYGLTMASGMQSKAFAARDFVQRTALHPHPPLHPNGSTAGTFALPAGVTWAAVNAALAPTAAADTQYFGETYGFDYLALFQALYGTVTAGTGVVANDGLLMRVGPGQYRWRSLATMRGVLCTVQDGVMAALAAALGLPTTVVSTVGHDASSTYLGAHSSNPRSGWLWNDLTYGEAQTDRLSGEYLSPQDLYLYSLTGKRGQIVGVRQTGPVHDAALFPAANPNTDSTYFSNVAHPDGMEIIGSTTRSGEWSGVAPRWHRVTPVQVPTIALQKPEYATSAAKYPTGTLEDVFPEFGVYVAEYAETASGCTFDLAYNIPTFSAKSSSLKLYRSLNGAAETEITRWGDTLVSGQQATYTAVDSLGVRWWPASLRG